MIVSLSTSLETKGRRWKPPFDFQAASQHMQSPHTESRKQRILSSYRQGGASRGRTWGQRPLCPSLGYCLAWRWLAEADGAGAVCVGRPCVSNKQSTGIVQSWVQSSQGTCVFVANIVRDLQPQMRNESVTFEQLTAPGLYETSVLMALVEGSGSCGLWNKPYSCTQTSVHVPQWTVLLNTLSARPVLGLNKTDPSLLSWSLLSRGTQTKQSVRHRGRPVKR